MGPGPSLEGSWCPVRASCERGQARNYLVWLLVLWAPGAVGPKGFPPNQLKRYAAEPVLLNWCCGTGAAEPVRCGTGALRNWCCGTSAVELVRCGTSSLPS